MMFFKKIGSESKCFWVDCSTSRLLSKTEYDFHKQNLEKKDWRC